MDDQRFDRVYVMGQRTGWPPDLVCFVEPRRLELVESFAALPDDPFDWIVGLAETAASAAALFPAETAAALVKFCERARAYRIAYDWRRRRQADPPAAPGAGALAAPAGVETMELHAPDGSTRRLSYTGALLVSGWLSWRVEHCQDEMSEDAYRELREQRDILDERVHAIEARRRQ